MKGSKTQIPCRTEREFATVIGEVTEANNQNVVVLLGDKGITPYRRRYSRRNQEIFLFCSLLEGHLAHSRCSLRACWMSKLQPISTPGPV